MAFPLSSAIISHKLSFNVSIAPSTRRSSLKPTHFIFCFNGKDPERSGRCRVHCLPKNNHLKTPRFPEQENCFKEGNPCIHKHEDHTGFPGGDFVFAKNSTEKKPYGTMEGNVKKALKIATDEKDSILASIPTDLREKGSTLYASLIDGKNGLQALLACIKDKDPDKAYRERNC
ncbi:hypothetical protein GBA52_013903 [Prunus armeniaca]|nr:hypothetical protein GBA52_013903 [Prunus armeniaca]